MSIIQKAWPTRAQHELRGWRKVESCRGAKPHQLFPTSSRLMKHAMMMIHVLDETRTDVERVEGGGEKGSCKSERCASEAITYFGDLCN